MADVFAYLEGFGVSGGSPNKSTIIVTAPTGSTVTCKMGSTTKTAAEKNGVWTFGGLDLGTWTITSTKGGDSATQDVSITRLTVEYVTIVYRITPEFTYTGDYEVVDDSDNPISDFAGWKNNWKIRFLTSGTFTVTKLNGWNGQLDVFLVGGGGGTKWSVGSKIHSGGAGGGYTQTGKAITVTTNTPYQIDIGAGGIGAADGGTTSAFGLSAGGGGESPTGSAGAAGGSGGGGYVHANASGTSASGAGNGGSDGSDGITAGSGGGDGGKGQGTTTREFGEENGKPYAGGGAGASNKGSVSPVGGAGGGGDMGSDGATNTGGGAGNALNGTHNGGSGIVVVRNARGAA